MRTQLPGAALLSLAEYDSIMARQKSLVSVMSWTGKRGRVEVGWVTARMGLQFDDEVYARERFFVECQWRKASDHKPEYWTFNILFEGQRIYAVHVQPLQIHENCHAGKGRPKYGQQIDGVHEHTWSADGDGYAEPIDVPVDQPEIVWKKFLKRANINAADFFHPDHNQPELDL